MARTFQTSFLLVSAFVAAACSADVADVFNDQPTGGGGPGGHGHGGSGTAAGPSGGSPNDVGGSGPSGGFSSDGGNGGVATTTTSNGGGGGVVATCGDGNLDAGEECDGPNLNGHDCGDLGFTNAGGAACGGNCHVDYTGCAASCDGTAIEPGEVCDGFDTGGIDCTDFGYANGFGLGCAEDCASFDATSCNAQCGNGVLEPGETCDGDDVQASCTDFGFTHPTPNQPHCNFFCGIDPSGCQATCGDGVLEPTEQCDDGNTTGGDGCSATCRAEGTSCASAIPITLGNGQQTVAGDTTNGGTGLDTDNALCPAGAAGKSRVYAVTVGEAGFLTAWLDRTGTNFDSVLYAQASCGDDASTILCADNSSIFAANAGGGEVVSFPVEQGDTVFLVVDGVSTFEQGPFSLTVDLSAGSTCNDPIPLPIWSGSQMTVLGFTNGKTQSGGGSCGGGTPGTGASDVVYRIDRRTPTITNMNFSLPTALTSFDSVLYGRFDCTGNEIACDDDIISSMGGEQIDLPFQNNNTRYVWIDGFNGAEGDYGMVIAPTP